MKVWVALIAVCTCLAGCGSPSHMCTELPPTLSVTPASATADHAAFPPGNQQQFLATSSAGSTGVGCATPEVIVLLKPAWTVSDPLDVSISSATDSTNGLATCLGPTKGNATVTAHISASSGTTLVTASLHCE